MPYIKREHRGVLDKDVEELIEALKKIKDNDLDGCFNYTITKIANSLYGGGGYAVYARLMGTLDCVGREFYRRVIAPYEDMKIRENGDVY